MDNQVNRAVVFFDGVCGLCNHFVDYLIVADKKQKYQFAPLQGETFRMLTIDIAKQLPDSVVLYSGGGFFTKSTAALNILTGLGGWYVLLNVFFLIPRFLRDHIYDFVARNRYHWFGKKETCRLPSPDERKRFLD